MKISSKKWSSFTRKYISLRFLSTKFTPSRKTRKFYILNFLNVWNNSIKWLSLKKIYWNGENIISSLFDRSSLPVYVTSYNENSKSFFVNSFSSFICSNVKFSNISLEQIPDFSMVKSGSARSRTKNFDILHIICRLPSLTTSALERV